MQLRLKLLQLEPQLHSVRSILEAEVKEAGACGRVAIQAIQRGIRFEGVSFSYAEGGPRALDQVTFEVPAGGCTLTAEDLNRFCDMFLHDGELDGYRMLSRAMIELIGQNHTQFEDNALLARDRAVGRWPTMYGLGFLAKRGRRTGKARPRRRAPGRPRGRLASPGP